MFGKEPYLVNPHLLSLGINPKKEKKAMAKKKSHRQPAALKAYWARMRGNTPKHRRPKRHSASRRVYAHRYAANPPRRRRHYRRNPGAFAALSSGKLFGLGLIDFAYAGGGFIAPPMIEGFIVPYVPAMLQSGMGRYALKLGVVGGLSYAANKFVSSDAGKMVAIGGAVYILANAVIDLAPSLFAGFSGPRGFMNPGSTTGRRLLPRGPANMRSQPFLGRYGIYGDNANPSTDLTVERMNPDARF
jgi:hypothetical protein